MKLLIIIPAYNEGASIVATVENLKAVCPGYDFIIVNDGSSDDTSALCSAQGYPTLELPINIGLAGAFQTGMRYAFQKGYDYALQFDADGQHLPQYIEPMFEKAQEGANIVIGSRFIKVKKPKNLRIIGSYLISWTIKLTTGAAICDPTSGMRLYDREMIAEFASNINYGPEPDTISYLIKNGTCVSEVQVEMGERKAGKSYFDLGGSMWYMVKMLLSILIIQFFRLRVKSGEGRK
ncbi:MAG: glycosyltransferase family 2 protein [Oscillospiraceae bacterium]|nr:glycosyltransferase family 2 protein [Oscillospiraceae bacterium]